MPALDKSRPVGVIGAGTMGAGIAQVAAAAGHPVFLFDAIEGAAEAGRKRVQDALDGLVSRGRVAHEDAVAIGGRIHVVAGLEAFADAGLVVEAIVEDLEAKRAVLAKIEGIITSDAILASNTSSIFITSIARNAKRPERVAGLHFFNPAPVMKLVEVVSGVATASSVVNTLVDTAKAWGKIPATSRSTPGFIVNRVARPYYAEALRLFEEQVADAATLDALLIGAEFRMGPFKLMDLIGHDVNYAVTVSVFEAFYQEPRFRPSLVQRELVNAGHLGRKSGRGFYSYLKNAIEPTPATEPKAEGAAPIDGFVPGAEAEVDGIRIVPTDGRTATDIARSSRKPVIVYDYVAPPDPCSRLGFAASQDVPASIAARFVATLQSQGIQATRLPDWPGLVVMRTMAMLANEGFEAVLQGVADAGDIDAAMRYDVNYPLGPIEWARKIGLDRVLSVLDNIYALTGDPRYRASLGLRCATVVEGRRQFS